MILIATSLFDSSQSMAVLEAKRELGLISAEEIENRTIGLKKKIKNRRRATKQMVSEDKVESLSD